MKFFFVAFLFLLSFATVLGLSIDDLPETHISDDFIETVLRRSSPKRGRLVRRLNLKLKRLNNLLILYKQRVREAQANLKRRARKAVKAAKKLEEYQSCVRLRSSKGRGTRICGDGDRLRKRAVRTAKRRANARTELIEIQELVRRIRRKSRHVQRKLDRVLGHMMPRPSVSPLAIA